MKRIFTTLFFVAMMATTVNAQSITFSYLEQPKVSVTTKYVKTAKKKSNKVYASTRSYTQTASVSVSVPRGRFNAGPRPGAWCGWYMRTKFGGGPEYNLARNWAKRGVSAGGPRIGAVVVWPHHVGVIVGRSSNGRWLVHSGNTGVGKGRARGISTKARSVSGAIAFRML